MGPLPLVLTPLVYTLGPIGLMLLSLEILLFLVTLLLLLLLLLSFVSPSSGA